MAINKVVVNRDGVPDVLLDLTGDSVTADSLVVGYTAHDKKGYQITGANPYVKSETDATVDAQALLIQQIKTALEGKTGGGGGTVLPTLTNPGTAADLAAGKQLIDANGNVVTGTMSVSSVTVKTASTKPSSNSTSISFTGLTASPKMFAIIPTGNITLGTTRYVTGVVYNGSTVQGTYGYRSGSSGTSYYSSSYFTMTYSSGTLTVKTSSSTNGGNFSSSVTYQLVYVA